MKVIEKYGKLIIIALLLLVLLKGCGDSASEKATAKKIEVLDAKVDSLSTKVISAQQVWETMKINNAAKKDEKPQTPKIIIYNKK